MSLKLRHHLYYSFCVTARYHLSPAATSVKEVQFIHESFKTLAPVEFFAVDQVKGSPSNPFSQYITVVLNASDQHSQLNPFNGIDASIKPSASELLQKQHELYKLLGTICGLPRFSFVENDHRYFDEELCVPFKHTLTADARYLTKQYEISDSTITSPFFTLHTDQDAKLVSSKLRHNFQKYHKMKPVKIVHGLARLRNQGLYKEKIKLDLAANTLVDVSKIMDLQADLETSEPPIKEHDFCGFVRQ